MSRVRLYLPDEVLLRRFGLVRAVGGAAYFVGVAVLFGLYGRQVWPLALGVPILAVVTTAFFMRSQRYPRAAVVASLVADALVLGGAVAFVGGTGSGAVMLYAIVVVSAGVLLGPAAALGFTALVFALSLLQLALEQAGVTPALLARPDLGERVTVLLISLALLASVGYLGATYAGRLHQLIAEGGAAVDTMQRRGRRRRSLVRQASVDVAEPLREVEAVAEALQDGWEALDTEERRRLAARLRFTAAAIDDAVGVLADAGTMDEAQTSRPEPVLLRRAVEDCIVGLGDRLAPYVVEVDVPPLKVAGDRRAVRRVVFNLLDNIIQHTPPGTAVSVRGLVTGGQGVLVITDDGPGVPSRAVARLFRAPEGGDASAPAGWGVARVGLPLVAELCAAMGAAVRHEVPPAGGARFLVGFRLAPAAAPSADDEPSPQLVQLPPDG